MPLNVLKEIFGFDSFLGDVRDSWMAPNNTEELRKLAGVTAYIVNAGGPGGGAS